VEPTNPRQQQKYLQVSSSFNEAQPPNPQRFDCACKSSPPFLLARSAARHFSTKPQVLRLICAALLDISPWNFQTTIQIHLVQLGRSPARATKMANLLLAKPCPTPPKQISRFLCLLARRAARATRISFLFLLGRSPADPQKQRKSRFFVVQRAAGTQLDALSSQNSLNAGHRRGHSNNKFRCCRQVFTSLQVQ